MAEISIEKQNNVDVSRLRATMDAAFKYVGHEITQKGFAKMISDILRAKRCQIKRKGTLNPTKKPINIQDNHWDALGKYWDEKETNALCQYMCHVRDQVKNVFTP